MKQREIKFRAWNEITKKMIFSKDKELDRFWDWTQRQDYEINIMQYTGLKDKNDKEVYEKDMIKYKSFDNSEQIAEVPEMIIMNCHWFSELEDCKDIEVIGNICKNPELLK